MPLTQTVALKKSQLSAEYSHINPASLPQSDCFTSASEGEVKADSSALSSAKERESPGLPTRSAI